VDIYHYHYSSLVQQIPSGYEWLFIIILVAVLIFGAKKIPELARGFGKATSEFEKAKIEAKRQLDQVKDRVASYPNREKLESIADSLGIDYTNKNDDELREAIQSKINKEPK
jgi:sec-independent protein translocase protein TatA